MNCCTRNEYGIRKGEIIALRWPYVLLDERRLVIRQASGRAAVEHRESPAALVWPGRNDEPLGRKTPNQLLGRILNRATRDGRIGSGLGVGRQGVVDQPVEVPDRALALGQQATERHHV